MLVVFLGLIEFAGGQEPNLGPSRLALLIESLASGADVFSSNSVGGCVNEMEVVLDQLP